ncbi:MAG: hypothetical protein HY907_06430 [Deltaproteobacteria bacterium]|nr:hypothetical protein [Deltaproteobacteria bacterium]
MKRTTRRSRAPAAVLAVPLALVLGCGSTARRDAATPPVLPRADLVVEAFEMDWPDMDRYEQFQPYVGEGLETGIGNAQLCRYYAAEQLGPSPQGGATRCRLGATGTLRVGGRDLVLGLLKASFEWDGMYGYAEAIAIGVPLGPADGGTCCRARVVAVVTQWDHAVHDSGSRVIIQRALAADVDGDGTTELCLEQIVEDGPGLFEVFDLEDAGRRWAPDSRERKTLAYRINAEDVGLIPVRGACPDGGYELLIPTPPYQDPLGYRRDLR